MKSERLYPLTQLPDEFLAVSWEPGFRQIELTYRGELLVTFKNASDAARSVELEGLPFRTVELFFDERKNDVNVVADGLHSPANRLHPVNDLKRYGFYFLLLAVFSILTVQEDFGHLQIPVLPILPMLGWKILFGGIYLLVALFVFLGKPLAYWIGLGLSVFSFLIYLFLSRKQVGMTQEAANLIRVLLLGVGAFGARIPFELRKYRAYERKQNDDLLDTE